MELSVSKTNKLVLNYNASNIDVAAKKQHILIYEGFTHIFNLGRHKRSEQPVLSWTPKISGINQY